MAFIGLIRDDGWVGQGVGVVLAGRVQKGGELLSRSSAVGGRLIIDSEVCIGGVIFRNLKWAWITGDFLHNIADDYGVVDESGMWKFNKAPEAM